MRGVRVASAWRPRYFFSYRRDMKRIVVTPAGRKRYMELLYRHLSKQRDSFDQWVILVNTSNTEDIGYCERLAGRNEDWIDTRYATGSDPGRGNLNIFRFLNEFCSDPDAMYLRLDDDVVYLAPDFVRNMFAFREANPEYFLTYGNIINNSIISWIHQKRGNFSYPVHSAYTCLCDVGWKDPKFAEQLHAAFVESPTDPKWQFGTWIASDYDRISINAISWFGRELAEAPVAEDEELWLSVLRPRELGRKNAINGDAVCAHFAYHTQREHLDAIDMLGRYAKLAPSLPAPRQSSTAVVAPQ